MNVPINQRKKRLPKHMISVRFMGETVEVPKPLIPITVVENMTEEEHQAWEPGDLSPHQLRKKELSQLHGIPEKDIFVDPGNGVELYRTINRTWVTDPINREG